MGKAPVTPLRLIVLLPLLTACATLSQNADLSCGEAGPNTYYFPADTFYRPDTDAYTHYGHGGMHDENARDDYSNLLSFLGEPSLTCGAPPGEEIYRFVWSPSFDPPATVRITRVGDIYVLDAATSVVRDKTRYRIKHIHRTLTQEEWSGATSLLEKLNFWNQPTYNEPPFAVDNPRDGTVTITTSKDGAQWVIEGRADRYHVIDRWSDDMVGTSIGLAFFRLANLGIPEEDIY
jgi:hypothetical protein